MIKMRHILSGLLLAAVSFVHTPAQATFASPDAVNGKALFANTNGASKSCASSGCHNGFPTSKINKINNGATNKGSLILSAISGNTGGMGVLNGFCNSDCAADLSAYIANPAAGNVVLAPVASVSPSSLSFAGTIIATSAAPQTATLSNTGNAPLSISAVSFSGANAADFSNSGTCTSGTSVAAGSSCTLVVGFTPASTGSRAATLSVTHNASGGTSSVALTGTGNPAPAASISISQSLFDYGAVVIGTSSPVQTVTVTNSGTAVMSFSSISFSGANAADFARSGGTCASTLGVGASCTITVAFTPSALGSRSASLSIAGNASNGTPSVTLVGTGTPVPAPISSLNTTTLAFGTATLGAAVSQSLTLTNSGNAALSISSVAISGSSAFAVASNNCGATLAASATCTVVINFTPALVSAVSGSLVMTDNASGSPRSVTLSGTGTSSPTAQPRWVSAAPLVYSTTDVGQASASQTSTLTNAGNAPFTPTAIVLSGTAAADFQRGGSCQVGTPVAASQSCTVTISFAPSQAGSRTASVSVTTDGGAVLALQLTGQGNQLATTSGSFTPANLDFGAVDIATGATGTIHFANTGTAPLQAFSAQFTGGFTLGSNAGAAGDCAPLPFTLLSGQACDLKIVFPITAVGAITGSMTLTTNAPTPAMTATLGGTATQAAATQSSASSSSSGSASSADPTLAAGTSPAAVPVSSSSSGLAASSTSSASPLNAGAGGCVSGSGLPADPTLPLLGVVALIALIRRRFASVLSK
jgi:hypothetical protein